MEYYLQHCFLVSFVLLVWLQTNAFYEYAKLFGFKKLFKIKDYSDFSKGPEELGLGLETAQVTSLTYLEYLKAECDNFFVRLITCPICLGTWLNIIICLLICTCGAANPIPL